MTFPSASVMLQFWYFSFFFLSLSFISSDRFGVCKAVGETRKERFGSGMCLVSAVGWKRRGSRGREGKELKKKETLQLTKRYSL